MHRRSLLRGAAALAALQTLASGRAAAGLQVLGAPQAFDYAVLKGRARALAGQPHVAPSTTLPEAIRDLNWDRHQAIRYRADHALWADEALRFRAQFFHLGLFFKSPVRIHEVVDGQARELAYDPELFDYGRSGVMSFIVSHNGKVYEKNLGPNGEKLAIKMTAFDPTGWKEVAP